LNYCLRSKSLEEVDRLLNLSMTHPAVGTAVLDMQRDHPYLMLELVAGVDKKIARSELDALLKLEEHYLRGSAHDHSK